MKHTEYRSQSYVELVDLKGARHFIHVGDVGWAVDSDVMRNECVLVVSGKSMVVQAPLDIFRALIRPLVIGKKTLH